MSIDGDKVKTVVDAMMHSLHRGGFSAYFGRQAFVWKVSRVAGPIIEADKILRRMYAGDSTPGSPVHDKGGVDDTRS